jgi:hypothetical protein
MFIFTRDWDVRMFWGFLPLTAKGYLITLFIAAAYTTYFLIRTLIRLHRMPLNLPSSDNARLNLDKIALTNGLESIRQFHKLLFLLFGVFFTDEMFATIRGIRLYELSLSGARMDIFEALTALAFIAFIVLLFLHIFQWGVAARLQSHRVAKS